MDRLRGGWVALRSSVSSCFEPQLTIPSASANDRVSVFRRLPVHREEQVRASVSAAGGRALGMEGAVAAAAAAVFKGSVSSCFEPHLKAYVELEERQLSEHLEKIVAEETWDVDESAQVEGTSPKTPRRPARRLVLPAAKRGASCPVDHPHRGPLLTPSHRHQRLERIVAEETLDVDESAQERSHSRTVTLSHSRTVAQSHHREGVYRGHALNTTTLHYHVS
eukprot:1175476-Prorocentrum_minimum.AAC.2